MNPQNPLTVAARWYEILLALVPGLALIALKSGILRIPGELSILPSIYALPILCLALVLASLLRARRFEVWSYPALGIVLATGLMTSIGMISAVAQSLIGSNSVSPFIPYALVWGILLLLALRYRLGSIAPRTVWMLLAVLIGVHVAQYSLDVSTLAGGLVANGLFIVAAQSTMFLGFICLPVLIPLSLARKDGAIAALVILAVEYFFYDMISDPGYALGMHTQDARVVWLVNYLPAIGLLILSPLSILTARSFRFQVIGFLFPASLVLLITELLSGSVRFDYTPVMWLLRGLGASEYILIVVLAIVNYRAIQNGKAHLENKLRPVPEAI